MATPATISEFLDLVRKSGVSEDKRLEAHMEKLRAGGKLPSEPAKLAGLLVRDGYLTRFQAEQIMQGKWRRFTIGKYKVLERLGSGGMGSVYLCEHKLMRRRVAVKVLPTAKASDEAALQRFYREARAAAALDHPNIVHAYDIDQDENLHFLVMEYVDGASLQEIVGKTGPMTVARAAHYIRHAAIGLEHAHQAGLVHRDIKPGNILVDRTGVVKILDMGLARFFNDQDDILTRKYDENVLGTADYLAPEQAIDSHEVDIRADVYSLGATFYFLLTGKTPLGEGTVGQKLMWLHSRQVKPVHTVRPDVPAALSAVIDKMMAKDPGQRYDSPQALVEALAPWGQAAIKPPLESEMPHLSLAASGGPSTSEPTLITSTPDASSGQKRASKPPSHAPTPKPSLPVLPAPAKVSVLPAPQPAPVGSTAPVEELAPEEAPWQQVASETEDLTAALDTSPVSSAHKVTQAKQKRARDQERRQIGRIAVVITLIALVGLAFGFWRYFQTESDTGPPPRPNLQVTKNASGPFSFRTIDLALKEAQRGDIIELLDSVHEENLTIDKHRGAATAVTIQPSPGKQVTWRPRKASAPLLTLSKAHGFKLKGPGLTLDANLDAKQSIPNLVFITLDCPGLSIQNIHLKGFSQNAIKIVNGSGEEGNPMRFVNLSITPAVGAKTAAAFYFDANPSVLPRVNDYIEFIDFRSRPDVKFKDKSVLGANVHLPK